MTEAIAPVSVVIPCFLCRDTIERAVRSVVDQSMRPAEILLVDDASPDGGATVTELERLAERYGAVVPIRVVPLAKNGGPGTARNRGWDLAGQPFVAFLDADDAWLHRKIEIQYTWMRDHPAVMLTCHDHRLRTASDSGSPDSPAPAGAVAAQPIDRRSLLFVNAVATRTVMLRRDVSHRFKEGKRHAEDYLLWLEMTFLGMPGAKLDSVLAVAFKRDFGEGGISAGLVRMELGELDCYRRLHQAGLIGWWDLAACSVFSVAKFLRRLVLVCVRRTL